MKKFHIVEKYKTSFGTVIITDDKKKFSVGDKIIADDGMEYIIKKIHMPTRPNDDEVFGILV